MKKVELTQGKCAIIDDEFFELVCKYNWFLEKRSGKNYGRAYAGGGRKNKKHIYLHRLITNAERGKVVDHINGDGLDNRLVNLRVCSQSTNLSNRKILSKNNTTGFMGVSRTKNNKFYAYIKKDYKRKHLGTFDSKIIAAKVYNKAAKKLFGEYCYQNDV